MLPRCPSRLLECPGFSTKARLHKERFRFRLHKIADMGLLEKGRFDGHYPGLMQTSPTSLKNSIKSGPSQTLDRPCFHETPTAHPWLLSTLLHRCEWPRSFSYCLVSRDDLCESESLGLGPRFGSLPCFTNSTQAGQYARSERDVMSISVGPDIV